MLLKSRNQDFSKVLLLCYVFLSLVGALPTIQDEQSSVVRSELHTLSAREENLNELETSKRGQITIIYARGTVPPWVLLPPNVDDLGLQFMRSVAKAVSPLKEVRQGITYAANIANFAIGGDPVGSLLLAETIAWAIINRPKTRIVVAGYSQGAQLVHNAFGYLTDKAANKVNSVVLFGSPHGTDAIPKIPKDRVKRFCHKNDNTCHGAKWPPSDDHKNYGKDCDAAAKFVAARNNDLL